MIIQQLIERLSHLGYVETGMGPQHPSSPILQIEPEINNFLEHYPTLARDEGYVNFLEIYAGLGFEAYAGELILNIFGFDPAVALHILEGEGEVVDEQGFLTFASLTVPSVGKYKVANQEYVGIGFAFDTTSNRQPGVYRGTPETGYLYYRPSFLDWWAAMNNEIEAFGSTLPNS